MDARVDAMVQRLVSLRDWLSRSQTKKEIECSEVLKGAQGMYDINTLFWSEHGTSFSLRLSREECAGLITDPVEILVQQIQDSDAHERYSAGKEAGLLQLRRTGSSPRKDINGDLYYKLLSWSACAFSLDECYGERNAVAFWDGLTQLYLCTLAPEPRTYVAEPGADTFARGVLPADMDLMEREFGRLERWARKFHTRGHL